MKRPGPLSPSPAPSHLRIFPPVRLAGLRSNYSFVRFFIVNTPSTRSEVNETLSPGFAALNNPWPPESDCIGVDCS